MRRTISSWLSTSAKLGFRRNTLRGRRTGLQSYHSGYSRTLAAEQLENRRLLAITVTSEFDDNGAGITLREAVVAASPGETISFSTTLNGKTIQLVDEISIDKPLTIQGPGADLLRIKAFGATSAVGDGDRIFHIYNTNNVSGVVTVSGLTLTGGDLTSFGGAIYSFGTNLTLLDLTIVGNSAREGGGIYVNGTGTGASQITISGCQIGGDTDPLRNVSSERGGGVFIEGIIGESSVSITSSSIVGNRGRTAGGGLYLSSGGLEAELGSYNLLDCIISGNQVLGLDDGTPNHAEQGDGGGIYIDLYHGSALETDNQFIIDRSEVSNNLAYTSGGGILVNALAFFEVPGTHIFNSTIDNNIAYGSVPAPEHSELNTNAGGGGIAYRDNQGYVKQSLINSTVSSNRALNGGGILFGAPVPTDYSAANPTSVDVRHSTIAFNTAGPFASTDPDYDPVFSPPWGEAGEPTAGGGVGIRTNPGAGYVVPSFEHTVIANNEHIVHEPTWYDEISPVATELSPDLGCVLMWTHYNFSNPPWPLGDLNLSYSIVGDRTGPLLEGVFAPVGAGFQYDTGNPGLDPNLQQNGASPTLPDGTAVRTHALLPGSIAIDAGNPNFTPPPHEDQRGYVRVVNGDANPDVVIDIGAYEYSAEPVCRLYGDYNDDGKVNAADYSVWRDHLGQVFQLSNEDLTATPGIVTLEDYQVWKVNFGKTCDNPNAFGYASTFGDATEDGVVNMADLDEWSATFGSTTLLDADWSGNGIVDLADLALWQQYKGISTSDSLAGDFNDDGVVDSGDYQGWSDPGEEADFYANFGTTRADVWPVIINAGGGPVEVAGQAPQVTNIAIGGPVHPDYSFASVVGSGEQLRTVPVGGMNSISITFSEEVLVKKGDLLLTGLQGQTIPSVTDPNFTFDSATQTASWTFSSTLPKGQYLIRLSDAIIDLDQESLDGEFDNPWALADAVGTSDTFPSGNGEAGGEFRFRFTNASADFTRNNVVDSSDFSFWSDHNGHGPGELQTQGDANGDGFVNTADHQIWASQFLTNFTAWPFAEPGMILVTTLTDENGTNSAAMSLREALDVADDNPARDTIVFKDSLFTVGAVELDLTSGNLVVDSNVTIVGPGAGLLTIDAQQASRVFHVLTNINATIAGLTAKNGKVTGGSGWGGGILNWGNLTLEDSVVSNSEATVQGGGISSSGTLRVRRSTISNNKAPTAGGIGVKSDLADAASIVDSAIINNEADYAGGVRFDDNNNMSGPSSLIVNTTFSGNKAKLHGGAIINTPFYLVTIINSTVTNNQAGYTTSTGEGGGIYNAGGGIVMQNTIVAGNTAVTPYWSDFWGTSLASPSINNLIGRVGGTGLTHGVNGNLVGTTTPLNAGLKSLGNYGGPTMTHALLSTSDAIDMGSSDVVDGYFADLGLIDQRGGNRVVDWDGIGGERLDIGAVELAFGETHS